MKSGLFMTMAAAALALAGCSNDGGEMDNGPVELRLTSGVTVQTRAYTATQGTAISRGEAVSVWVDDAGTPASPLYKAVQLEADGNNGFTGDAMYFPGTGNNTDIYAVHGNFTTPFAPGSDFPKSGAEYKVEADQSSVDNKTNYTKSDLLYAYEKGVARSGNPTTAALTFYHMLSKLELAIKAGDGAPELATSGAVKLNGITLDGKFTPSTTENMSEQSKRAAMLGDANTATTGDMTLGQKTCTDFAAGNVDYNEAILVPQDMAGKKLTFSLKDGGTLTYTIPANTTFESGKKYQYHITLDLTGITVTSSIKDWELVTAVDGSATMQ